MRPFTSGLVALAMILALTSQASATIIFSLQASGTGDNVLLNSGQVGNVVTGTLNSDPSYVVTFSSSQSLTEPAMGQARITATSGLLTDITITPQSPVAGMVFNPFQGSGSVTVTVNALDAANNPEIAMFSYMIGNGQNFLTITTADGERITSVNISADEGFTDLRQVRIDTGSVSPVPEPGSFALLAFSGLSLLGFARLRRVML